MTEPVEPSIHPRTWAQKFRDAYRGLRCGVRRQSSFVVHCLAAAAVIVAAIALHAQLWQWCVLLLCIAGVMTAEMFNSAIEFLAKVVQDKHDPRVADALDTASAAVLVAAIGAAIVGAIVFVNLLCARIAGG